MSFLSVAAQSKYGHLLCDHVRAELNGAFL